MNILIIINSFRLGGAEKLCYDLAHQLSQKQGINVFLYSVGKIETQLEHTVFQMFGSSTINVGSFNKPYKKQRVRTILKIKKFCKINKIDVVHTNGQSPDFLARCSKILGNKAKIVVTIHNTIGYSKKHEKFFGRFTDAYTVVSKNTLLYSQKELSIIKKIELIDNGIDLQKYSEINNIDGVFEILSVGRIQPQKDYIKAAQFLEKFLKRHKDVKWLIFGDCSYNKTYFNAVKEECEKLGIINSVVFKGVESIPQKIFCHGKVFVLASPFEGFGIAFIEAIMSNHYIFSRNVGAIQDVLQKGGTVHIIDDIKSLDVLENIYLNLYHSDEIERNKTIVKSLYSITDMVEKYLAVYKGVMSNE